MKQQDIHAIVSSLGSDASVLSTHISWVILTGEYAYKIKKPIKYDFLDFSTLEKRKHFCQREMYLNQRLTTGVYLATVPVFKEATAFTLEQGEGEVVEYAVKMKRLDTARRMDLLLEKDEVSLHDIESIAEQLIPFHQQAEICYTSDRQAIQKKFNALGDEVEYISKNIAPEIAEILMSSLMVANQFIADNEALFNNRARDGYVRDCHGDLHSRNIFLTDRPVIFDCIEFNDDFRKIDVLSEIAFLCMDLEAFGRPSLADHLLYYYSDHFNICDSPEEMALFTFYKAYYANVRAKVNILRLKAQDEAYDTQDLLHAIEKYIQLLDNYMHDLPT